MSFQSSGWQIRQYPPAPVHFPRGVSFPDTGKQGYQRGMPQYDGPDDGTPTQGKVGANKADQTSKEVERGELDPKEFLTDNHELPSGHEYAVNRFLDHLKKMEKQEMAKNPPKSGE